MYDKHIIVEGQSSVLRVGAKVCTNTKKMDRPGPTHHNEAESAGNKARKQMLKNGFDFTILDCIINLNCTSG